MGKGTFKWLLLTAYANDVEELTIKFNQDNKSNWNQI